MGIAKEKEAYGDAEMENERHGTRSSFVCFTLFVHLKFEGVLLRKVTALKETQGGEAIDEEKI